MSRAGAQHVVATKSGHCIQTTEPDLVIAAVRQVVEAARRGLSVVVTRDLSGLSEEFCSTGENSLRLTLRVLSGALTRAIQSALSALEA